MRDVLQSPFTVTAFTVKWLRGGKEKAAVARGKRRRKRDTPGGYVCMQLSSSFESRSAKGTARAHREKRT